MRQEKIVRRNLVIAMTACLGCVAIAQAGKPDKPGGGGGGGDGGQDVPYTLVTLPGDVGYALSVSEPDGNGAVLAVGHAMVDGARRPTLWNVKPDGSSTTTNLGLPPGALNAHATDVNDWGAITIHTEDSADVDENGNLILPGWVLVPGLPLQELPHDGPFARGNAINNFGEIVGYEETAVLWELDGDGVPNAPIDLHGFYPNDINDAGVMAGKDFGIAAVAWFDANGLNIESLGTVPGFEFSEATAISADGQWVAGWLYDLDGPTRAFVWSQQTGMMAIGALGGTASYATGVNSAGEVVGWATDTGGRHSRTAFLWRSGRMFDLNALAESGSKINLDKAARINEAGHVVGVMSVARVGQRAFLLNPNVP